MQQRVLINKANLTPEQLQEIKNTRTVISESFETITVLSAPEDAELVKKLYQGLSQINE